MAIPIRILLVEDHVGVRQALRRILEKNPDMRVVGEAGDGEEGLIAVERLYPDIIVLDIEMPIMDGLQVARLLRSKHNPVCILFLSGYQELEFIRSADALKVEGYLIKEDAPAMLVETIRRIARGEKGIFSPNLGLFRFSSTRVF